MVLRAATSLTSGALTSGTGADGPGVGDQLAALAPMTVQGTSFSETGAGNVDVLAGTTINVGGQVTTTGATSDASSQSAAVYAFDTVKLHAKVEQLARDFPTVVKVKAQGDAKVVELSLINAGVTYASVPAAGREAQPQLRLESPQATVRLVILSPQQRRNRPRRDRAALPEERLTLAQLRALLAAGNEG